MFKRICSFSLPLLLVGSVAFGQVTITRKFNEGESYKTRTTSKTTQKLTIAGQDGGTTSNTVIEQKTSIGQKDADGKLPITVETSVLSAEIGLPGGVKIKFDGKNPDAKIDAGGSPIAELVLDKLKANAKMSTTIVMAKDNTVAEVQGVKAESGVSTDDIKDEFAQQLKLLPNKPLKKGDTWEEAVKVNLGQGQIFTLKRKFTFEGEATKSTVDSTRKVLKITSVDSAVTFSVKEGGAPFKVSKSELKVDESKNVNLFDPEVGRTIESSSVLRVSGKIALSVNNMDLPGDLDLTLSSQMEEIK
ncbi:MAG: hypothetical protein K8R36_19685 [Planctomycetales bacterium]|nr:hypothetical protein [Planctomycetales bacterium]